MMSRLTKIFGFIGAVLVAFMVVGLLLPSRWSAQATVQLRADPDVVFAFMDDLGRWDEWTPWADMESELSDPARGAGAVRSWNDPQYGEGAITITESRAPSLVAYRVEIGGRTQVTGRLEIQSWPGGSLVVWREEGDFGWNPLMGYVARGMAESQGQQLLESLNRLQQALSN